MKDALTDRYRRALAEGLETSGEAAFASAYEVGRDAVADGRGLLDMAAIHHEVLGELVRCEPAAVTAAGAVFAESLAPFEMAYRGFREVNERLGKLNLDLEARNADLQRAKEEADAAVRELDAFSYSVSHDLRAPLRSIHGFSHALLEDQAERLDAEGVRYLTYVNESAAQMDRLIDDLLRLARTARTTPERAPVDLAPLARRVVARLRARDPERTVEATIAEALPATGDARLLEVVLDNLIGNAWKFTQRREDARIEVGMRAGDGGTVFFVADNGAGFDPEFAGKLFQPFQRLHSAEDFEGTGIGLATVQRIIRHHGGRVWATGAVGKGAEISFTTERSGLP